MWADVYDIIVQCSVEFGPKLLVSWHGFDFLWLKAYSTKIQH